MLFVTMALPLMFAMASISVDLGYIFYIKSRLQTAADLGALAGAKLIPLQDASTVSSQADIIAKGNLPTQWTNGLGTIKATVNRTVSCLGTTPFAKTDCDNNVSKSNAIRVSVSVKLPLFFASVFGLKETTINATSLAGSGNNTPPLDVVVLLDTTNSMNSTTDACKSAAGKSLGLSRQECAMLGVRGMLAKLVPSVANVSLMIYPGLKAGYAKYEYCESGLMDNTKKPPVPIVNAAIPGAPTGVAYYHQSPDYMVIADSSTYRLNANTPSPGGLDTADKLVKAVGGNTNCDGLQNVGGAGTFFADAMTKAKEKLQSNATSLWSGLPKRQGVIIILSDGDAGADKGGFSKSNQCQLGIDAAATATSSSIWVYSIAYNASLSKPTTACKYDNAGSKKTKAGNDMSPCQTMKEMASDSSKFYSVDTTCNAGTNSGVTDLASIFKNIAVSLMKTRRVSEAITN